MTLQETSSNQRRTSESQNSYQHNNCINFNINLDLEFSKVKDRTDV
jgi:hypothetical protein